MVRRRVIPSFLLIIAIAFELVSQNASAQPCQGSGTVIFYGNGMFNTLTDARRARRRLEEALKDVLSADEVTRLRFDVAYQGTESVTMQLVHVAVQKGVTDFQDFWAWLASLQQAPQWFKEAALTLVAEAFKTGRSHFTDIDRHFEAYAKAVRDGNNIVLVSHSQGNFFANQTMRSFGDYVDNKLTGSVNDKRKRNSLFPEFFDLFANVQVATPVSATVHSSPWSTFEDDLVIKSIRASVSVLPSSLKTSGVGPSADGDFLGHNFIKAYLRVDESRQKILYDIKTALSKLRYPIPHFQPTIVVEKENIDDGSEDGALISFRFHAKKNFGDLQMHYEERPRPGVRIGQDFVTCFDLPLGDTPISATTILTGAKERVFAFRVWPDGKVNEPKEKPIELQVKATKSMQHWDIGVIRAKAGSGKEPLDIKVEIYPKPKMRMP